LFNSMEKNVENLRVPQLIKKLMSSVDVFWSKFAQIWSPPCVLHVQFVSYFLILSP
jgi:hypothetical protein